MILLGPFPLNVVVEQAALHIAWRQELVGLSWD